MQNVITRNKMTKSKTRREKQQLCLKQKLRQTSKQKSTPHTHTDGYVIYIHHTGWISVLSYSKNIIAFREGVYQY